MELLCEPDAVPPPGAEVLISYGDKPNEELLFIYGFVEKNNPHDALVLQPPWMLKEAAAADAAAAAATTAGGKKQRKTPKVEEKVTTEAERVEAELEAEVRGARVTLRRLRGLPNQVILPATPPAGGVNALPKDVVSTLEVWGLTPQALEAELHAELGAKLGDATAEDTEATAESRVWAVALHVVTQAAA